MKQRTRHCMKIHRRSLCTAANLNINMKINFWLKKMFWHNHNVHWADETAALQVKDNDDQTVEDDTKDSNERVTEPTFVKRMLTQGFVNFSGNICCHHLKDHNREDDTNPFHYECFWFPFPVVLAQSFFYLEIGDSLFSKNALPLNSVS